MWADALPETGDGFSVDTGAAFLCSSYDVAFRICEVLGLSLFRSEMRLGWYRNGRWVTTTPGLSVGNLVRNLPAAWDLGFLSPRVMWPGYRCVPFIRQRRSCRASTREVKLAASLNLSRRPGKVRGNRDGSAQGIT